MDEQPIEENRQTQIANQPDQASQNALAQYYLEEQEKGIVQTQLEVETIISKIYHLLKQDILKEQPDGRMDWDKIDVKDRVLTDWGVDKLMQIINFYVNKNNLLSNYGEQQIDKLMLRFTTELNDLIYLKYEVIFRRPTFKECKDILKNRIKEKAELRAFSMELLDKKPDLEEIKKGLLQETEVRIEKEIQKIREEKIRGKIKEYGLLTAELEAMVLATFNRAWKGEERGSIRRHTNISEVISPSAAQPTKPSGVFGWIKR